MIVKYLSSLEGIIVVSIKRKCFGLPLRQKRFLAVEEGNIIINTGPFCAENFIYSAYSLLSLCFLFWEFKTVWTYCVRSSKKQVSSIYCDYRAGRKTSWFHNAHQSLVPKYWQKSHPETQLLQQVTHLLPSQNLPILKPSGFNCGSTKTSPAYLHWFKEIFTGLHLSININGQLINA